MELKALKSFSPRGAKLIRQGETFTASKTDAEIYTRNGLAIIEGSETTDEILTNENYTEEQLLEKNVSELKKIAKNKAVSGYTKLSKSELIFAILANQQNENSEG
jgi:hypothetical protein